MRAFFTLIGCLLIHLTGCSQNISANPGWSVSVPASSINEAGLDYSLSPNSLSNQTLISVTSIPGSFGAGSYQVFVQKADVVWNANLKLNVLRTGAGTGSGFFGGGSINGGLSEIELSNNAQLFFSGNAGFFGSSRTNVPIQYQITGLTVLIPAQSYSTTVIYTVTD